ncbi:MAG: hypothetical protein IPM94_03730 [bacterium]|nr:hypothetical protein [bacterium]
MSAPRLAAVVLLAACASVIAARPAASGVRDFDDGWCGGPAESAELLGGPARAGLWSACGLARLHGLEDLPLRRLAAGLRAAAWSSTLSWQRLGGEVWHEDQVDLCAARAVAGSGPPGGGGAVGAVRPWCGLALRWRRPCYAALATGASLDVAPQAGLARGRFSGSLQAVPLTLRRGPEAVGPRPWLGARWHDANWSAAVELQRDDRGAAAWRAGGELHLGAVFSWGLVADGGSGAAGLTTAWRRGRLLVRTSHVVHPALGTTHRWDLVVFPLVTS